MKANFIEYNDNHESAPSNDKAMAFYEALGFRQAENRFMEK